MMKPIPEFHSLKQITADGMSYTIGGSSFEFRDKNGKRFQTESLDAKEMRAVNDALKRGGVTLSIGPWQSALKNDSIFTIFHMTSGDRVLINYADMLASKKKEQRGALPVIAISFVLVTGITIFVLKENDQFNRQLEALRKTKN